MPVGVAVAPIEWTEAKKTQLRALAAEGHSYATIASMLGATKNAVVGQAHRLKLPARPSPIAVRGPRPVKAKPPAAGRITLPALPTTGVVLAAQVKAAGALELAARGVAAPKQPAPPARHVSGRRCCWPLGDPRSAGFRFCDAAGVVPGKPYCAAHCARAYTPPAAAGPTEPGGMVAPPADVSSLNSAGRGDVPGHSFGWRP